MNTTGEINPDLVPLIVTFDEYAVEAVTEDLQAMLRQISMMNMLRNNPHLE